MAQPYISRPETEAFLDQLATALQAPQSHPVVFQAWGIGGVGKSTLTRTVQEKYGDSAHSATVSFGLTEGIEEPIPLMAKLYGQMVPQDDWSADPFWTQYSLYFETIHQLKTQAATGRGAVGEAQVGHVKSLLQLGLDVAGEFLLSESAKKTTQTVVNRGMEAAVAGLSLKDELVGLLQQHKATKRNQALQQLMLEPLPQLTKAFATGLASQQRPAILVLDTYEKVPTAIDTWLWRTLLGNTDLANHQVRFVVAGRHCLLKTEGWRKLHQDRDAVYECTIERFDQLQTQQYLAEIDITDEAQVDRIFAVTRGLPYYLNWIREQTERGRSLDFDQGNQEIARLLLQGLNPVQTQVVQLAACCRWFDAKTIRHLTEQQGLDFAAAVDEERNCYGWLTQLSFAEPVGKRWRLDDVARDVFRQSLERDEVEAIHGVLADYFLALSDQEVPPDGTYLDKYENPDWRELRSEYLYHLLFTTQPENQSIFISHLLEARYFDKDGLVITPFQAITGEFELSEHPLLRHRCRQFLSQIRPAVLYGRFVLEEEAINYVWNERYLNLSKAETDRALKQCLAVTNQLSGLAQIMALLYQAKRCPTEERLTWLKQAQAQIAQLPVDGAPEFVSDIWVYCLGNSFYKAGAFEEAISAFDEALVIKQSCYEALIYKGIALGHLGRYEETITACNGALAIKSDEHKAWDSRGYSLAKLGQYDEAILSFDQALEINHRDANAIYNKAYAVFMQKDLDRALPLLKQAFELDSKYREMIKTDTDFDPIRSEPRFQELLHP
jgi:tetratricopeptide (TPR) repeat protein